jgi:copper(I)-binding protein
VTATHTKALAAAAVLLAVPGLSACGVNFGAQTDQIYTPADGENARDGAVKVLNALVVSGEPGSGRLIAGLANTESEGDELVGVRSDDPAITFEPSGGETAIPARGFLQLADDDAANIVVSGDEEVLRPGRFVRVTFTFANAEEASLNLPVMAPGTDYAGVELPGGDSGAETEPAETLEPSPTDAAEDTDEDTGE